LVVACQLELAPSSALLDHMCANNGCRCPDVS
jgi:hypothetical protein